MAFIGTPLDTRNTFQSLAGKRFNGDGSTTAFTLDVAPSSTLDIEVFVGNVRQDPNSAYTLSGTTLTFTGAPPSGTNNIYVVHQAKAVGTIDLPEGALVDLNGGSDKLVLDADGDTTISADTDDQIDFKAGGTDVMSMTATGLTINDGTTITTADNTDTLTLTSTDADADAGPNLRLYRNSSSPADSDVLGQIDFESRNDNSQDIVSARIQSLTQDVTDGTEDGKITINTIMAGTDRVRLNCHSGGITFSNASEAMRIDSGGKLMINTASDLGSAQGVLHVKGKSSNNIARFGAGTDGEEVVFVNESNTQVGSIAVNTSATAYNTSSDYRLKENEVAISDGLTRLKTLKPYRFNFKADNDEDGNPTQTVDGFFAHEVSSIVPEAITGTKDATETYTDDNGDEQTRIKPQAIDQSKLVPLLTSALQEAITKIETLEARVTTLEE